MKRKLKIQSVLVMLLLVLTVSLLRGALAENSYQIQLTASEGGTTSPQPALYLFLETEGILFSALPHPGYCFQTWIVDGVNMTGNATFYLVVLSNHNIRAVFDRIPYNLTISADSGGTVTLVPGVHQYAYGTQVSISATPNTGFNFANWILDGQNVTGNTLTLSITSNYNVRAAFSPIVCALTIENGAGGIVSGFNSSTYEYVHGTQINLTATPSAGYIFSRWLLDGAIVTQNPLSVTMNQNHTAQPVFQQPPTPTPTPTAPPAPTPTPNLTPTTAPTASSTQMSTPTTSPTPSVTMIPESSAEPSAKPYQTSTPTPTSMQPQQTGTPAAPQSPSSTDIAPLEQLSPVNLNWGIAAACTVAVASIVSVGLIARKRRRPTFTVLP
jgi:hypothetical protein